MPPSERCGRSHRTDEPSDLVEAYLRKARSGLDRVKPEELDDEIEAGALLVDARTSEQRERDGVMPGAEVIDLTVLEWRLAPSSPSRIPDIQPSRKVILICNEGFSSSLASARLQELGLPHATDLEGGFTAWRAWVQSGDRHG